MTTKTELFDLTTKISKIIDENINKFSNKSIKIEQLVIVGTVAYYTVQKAFNGSLYVHDAGVKNWQVIITAPQNKEILGCGGSSWMAAEIIAKDFLKKKKKAKELSKNNLNYKY